MSVGLQRVTAACLVVASSIAAGGCARKAEAPGATATSQTSPSAPPTSDRLIGRWLRADSDYTIEVVRTGPDGSVEVRYFNPNPIHVSRARWVSERERLALLVELQDRGYPGNFYELLYDPGSDALLGRYNHLGLNQVYEVAFSRIGP